MTVALVHRWLLASYEISFGPLFGKMAFRLDHLIVAVTYGVYLGLVLGTLHRLNKRAV